LNAIQALSQLSYGPTHRPNVPGLPICRFALKVADFLDPAPASETAPYILEGTSVKPLRHAPAGLIGGRSLHMGITTSPTKMEAPLDRVRMLH
jgi:hypothetical protein